MRFVLLILFFSFFLQSSSQDWNIPKISNVGWEIDESFSLNKKRRNMLLASEAAIYTMTLVSLNQLWYADYPRSKFHFINDNGEWLQMDKIGHMSASYYTGVLGIQAYQWAGFSRNKAIWYGGMTGSFFLTIIEILDGYSKQWGASAGDLISNTSGSLLAIGQALIWDEQRILLKYSYMPTKWAKENPSQLGSGHLERALKDYNGQTYWLTFNLKSLLNIKNNNFPSWFSLAFGYGANSMTQPYVNKGDMIYRQYFLSFDVDLSKIKTKSKTVNSILNTFGFLKFPAPAFEYANGRFSFHSIYY